jgi:hypothetical protein
MVGLFNKFSNWFLGLSTLKQVIVGIIVGVILIVVIAAIGYGIGAVIQLVKTNRKKTESFEAIKNATGSLTDELQKYVDSWNATVDNYYGIKSQSKEGFSLTKKTSQTATAKPETYESTRMANSFLYLNKRGN